MLKNLFKRKRDEESAEESDEVLAPVAGTLTHMFPTGHAAGITTAEGLEILIHVGLDTFHQHGLRASRGLGVQSPLGEQLGGR